ncbi:NAD-dependent epimerase/dehydratase family protein [Mucilaginibacter ginsenosidivorans]|uniref:NAD(P)-dependent oxidoreductase n=1 Tax=Mucilaginibacter ginsenosidivorans TaxID=398053 RepID=A0A5B8UUT6_9SPHI|nr:NAD(P)-dependent oxidoreductase [Mucilaginibacter ginsenosidivorans]QEC62814.1 NAD(P)-dependent oxidoreductase [Mucilaginibacter ginsenosidivorans]
MKVLVTGSSGQLGSTVVKNLKAHHHTVYGIDVIPSDTTDELIDLKNADAVLTASRGVDAIIHTAAVHGKHYALGYPREAFIETNIGGTLNLLNACVKNAISKFLFTSTTSIYGEAMVNNKRAVWVDESLIIEPRDIYDITKQAAEHLCRDFFYKEGLQASVYRVARFLPEDDNLKINHRIYRGLDERDGAEALRSALDICFEKFEVFNISAGSPFTRDELTQIKHDPTPVILKHYPDAADIYAARGWKFPGSIDRVYVSDKAKQYLGYQPVYTFGYLLHNL